MQGQTGLEGQTIGKYRLLDHLGRGGMADVYRAYQASLDRYVAIKIMNSFLAREPGFRDRFEREAKNVAALRHPNIIQVHDFDIHGDLPYMVMEYVEGGTLKTYQEQHAAQGRRVPLAEGLLIVRHVAQALVYAHRRHMIHRDIKPANVLLDVDGRVILTDFGIAKLLTGPQLHRHGRHRRHAGVYVARAGPGTAGRSSV
jgi:serine/threonine-protein kinase